MTATERPLIWFISMDNLTDMTGQALRIKYLIKNLNKYCDINLVSSTIVTDKELLSPVGYHYNIGNRIYSKNIMNPRTSLKFLSLITNIKSIIKYSKTSIIYTDTMYIPLCLILTKKNLPIVMEVNGIGSEELIAKGVLKRNGLTHKFLKIIEGYAYRKPDKLVAVTEGLRDFLVREFSVDPLKIAVIPNGVNIEVFDNTVDGAVIRAKYELGDSPVVLFVGTFRPWHGVENLIFSFKYVLTSIPAARLILVGDGPTRLDIEKLVNIEKIPNVIFTGRQNFSDIPKFVAASDVCVHFPYYQEHTKKRGEMGESPMKIFEYMAMSKPVVITEVKNLKELILKHNCGIVTKESYIDFSDAIISLIQNKNLARILGENGRKAVKENYGWNNIAEQIFNNCMPLFNT